MSRAVRIVLLLSFWSGACTAPDAPESREARVLVEPQAEAVADHVRPFIEGEVASKRLPALSIALIDDQRVVWAEGFGWERPEDSIPATPHTVYRVGSVSKLFTDLAIMRQVEAGRMDLDAPITDAVPEFAPTNPYGTPLTLRQLTSHRSGLVREPPVGHYFDDTGPTLAATVASLNTTALVFPPEARTKYSNAGIAVVGHALERVTSDAFADHLDREILEPLGMGSTSFLPTAPIRARLADAVMWTLDGRDFAAPTFQLGMSSAGSMYSTVLDLGRFLSALFAGGGGVVAPATLDSMWTPQYADSGATRGYGIGFAIGELDGHRSVGHGGAIYGFSTELLALPDASLGVVVATSRDIANTVAGRIAETTLRTALAQREGRPLPTPDRTTPVDPAQAERMEGRYYATDGSHTFDLLELSGRLFLDPAGGGFRQEFRTRGDALVTDSPLAWGSPLQETPDGARRGEHTWVRAPVPLPPPRPARWDGLIGEYGWDHNVLYIREDGGRLSALIEWFFEYALEEEGPDRFRFPDRGLYVGESLTFERDADGRAQRAILGGSVVFERRAMDGESGATFTIEPVRPLSEIREEALAAEPPAEAGEFRTPELVEITALDPSIRLDIRYAGTNNFMQAAFYDEPRAFLQRPAAEALVRAHRSLAPHGFGLLIHDGYRPWYVTRMFWDATPEDQKLFVADPTQGSRHNRGSAVDLTLYRLEDGRPVEMVSGYDEFSPRAFPDYPGGTSRARWHRELLREAMEDQGFTVYEWEWWHFDHGDWSRYPISNRTFDAIDPG